MKTRSMILSLLIVLPLIGCSFGGQKSSSSVPTGNEHIEGIVNGNIYYLNDDSIKATFSGGSATISRNNEAETNYISGTEITDVGNYVITLTTSSGSKESTSFTVKESGLSPISIRGVKDGGQYCFGNVISPTFTHGNGHLFKNDSLITSYFKSGDSVYEIGNYRLEVSDGVEKQIINFEIVNNLHEGEITDYFDEGTLNLSYKTTDAELSLDDHGLHIKDMKNGTGYCIVTRQFHNVCIEDNPYIELKVSGIKFCQFYTRISQSQYPTNDTPVATTRAYDSGIYYVDLKSYAIKNNIDLHSASFYVQFILEGQGYNDGLFEAHLEYVKSIVNPSTPQVAGPYICNDAEGFAGWTANTAKLIYRDSENAAYGVVINPIAEYGNFIKRIQLNTRDYPFLELNILDCVSGYKIDAFQYVNYAIDRSQKIELLKEQKKIGKTRIDLRELFGEETFIDLLLEFYVVGDDPTDTHFFSIDRIETVASNIITNLNEGGIYNSYLKPIKPRFLRGNGYLSKDGSEEIPFVSETEISEPGSYTLKVVADDKTEIVNFSVTKKKIFENTITDFLDSSLFTEEQQGILNIVREGNDFTTIYKKPSGVVAKTSFVSKFDFTNKRYIRFEFECPAELVPSSDDISIEVLDNVNWYRVIEYPDSTCEKFEGGDGRVGYVVYLDVTTVKHTGGTKPDISWYDTVQNSLKVSIMIQYGDEKSIVLNSISLTNSK